MIRRTVLVVGLVLLFSGAISAQWGPDVRLTVNDSASWTAWNNARSVAAWPGGFVHVVWRDHRNVIGGDNNWEIYYKRSTDGGVTWSSDTRLTDNPSYKGVPSVVASASNVHVVWQDNRDGNYEIYYKYSAGGGTTWSSDIGLTNQPAWSGFPCITVSDTVVHVVWQDLRDGNREIYHKRNPTANPTEVQELSPRGEEKAAPSPQILFSGSIFENNISLKFSESSKRPVRIILLSANGASVLERSFSYTPLSLTLRDRKIEELKSGIYFLTLYSGSGRLGQVKFIKP